MFTPILDDLGIGRSQLEKIKGDIGCHQKTTSLLGVQTIISGNSIGESAEKL